MTKFPLFRRLFALRTEIPLGCGMNPPTLVEASTGVISVGKRRIWQMTSIERTAYPRFSRAPSVKELREIYTPTPTDVAFVATTARGPAQKFGLMILLKVYQRLGYFPKPETIPGAIIGHIRSILKHLEIESSGKRIRHVAAQAMMHSAHSMESPADLISAAVEVLIKEQCELPAFGTLERMARRIRTLVHRGIYRSIATCLTDEQAAALIRLLEADPTSGLSAFHRIKEAP